VVRGKWILDNLIGAAAASGTGGRAAARRFARRRRAAMRQRMESTATSPVWRPLPQGDGPDRLALENFDAVGRWRTLDGESVIDASGELYDGTKRERWPLTLRQALAASVPRCWSARWP
jgi:hypothetical protein